MTHLSAKNLLSNAVSNAAGLLVFVLSNLIIVAIVVQSLGAPMFGHAAFILALASPIMLVGSILSQSLISLGSNAVGRRQLTELNGLYRECLILCIRVLVPIASLFFLGLIFLEIFMFPQGGPISLFSVLSVILAFSFRQITLISQGYIAALADYARLGALVGINALLDLALISAAMSFSPDLDSYFFSLLVTAFAAMVLSMFVVWVLRKRGMPLPEQTLDRSDWVTVQRNLLLRFGGWQALNAAAGLGANQINPILLGILGAPVALAHYNIAARLEQAVTSFLTKFSEVLLPHFGSMSREDVVRVQRQYILATWVICVSSSAIMSPLLVLAEPLLEIWINAEVAADGGSVLRILVVWGLINASSAAFSYYLLATGGVSTLAQINLFYGAVAIIASIILGVVWGAAVAPFGLVIAATLSAIVKTQAASRLLFANGGGNALWIRALLPGFIGVTLSLWLSHSIEYRGEGWLYLGVSYGGLAFGIASINVIVFAIRREDRQLLKDVSSVPLRWILKTKVGAK